MDEETELRFIELSGRVEDLESEVGGIEEVKRDLELLRNRVDIEAIDRAIRWIGQRLEKIEARLQIEPPPYPGGE